MARARTKLRMVKLRRGNANDSDWCFVVQRGKMLLIPSPSATTSIIVMMMKDPYTLNVNVALSRFVEYLIVFFHK